MGTLGNWRSYPSMFNWNWLYFALPNWGKAASSPLHVDPILSSLTTGDRRGSHRPRSYQRRKWRSCFKSGDFLPTDEEAYIIIVKEDPTPGSFVPCVGNSLKEKVICNKWMLSKHWLKCPEGGRSKRGFWGMGCFRWPWRAAQWV